MIKKIKNALGEVDLGAVRALLLALGTYYFPFVVGTLWLLIAVFLQFGIWDKLAVWFYSHSLLGGRPGAAVGKEMLKTVKKE